jgi:hypothetical protein
MGRELSSATCFHVSFSRRWSFWPNTERPSKTLSPHAVF